MPTYIVQLHLGFDRLPTRDEQAFLGPMNARVQPWGGTDLLVVVDMAAPDAAGALARAQELVVDRLGARFKSAGVALEGSWVQPTSLWRRWRRRR